MEGDVIRMGGYQGPASVHNRAAYVLGQALSDKTNGENTLTLIEDVTRLGRNSLDLFDMVEGHELDLCYFASSYLVHRVPNLAVFFTRHGQSLPVSKIASDYAPGDIVTWTVPPGLPHIGLVADVRTPSGIPLVIHNIGAGTRMEDRLFAYPITGHYRYPAARPDNSR